MKSPFAIAILTCLLASSSTTQALADSPSGVVPSRETDSDNESKARDLLQTGIAAYKKRDYVTARYAFLGAYELGVMPATAAMLADTEMKLQRYRDAADHWSDYLSRLPPSEATERAEVTAQIVECRKHLALIRMVVLDPKDAEVLVDGIRANARIRDGELWLEPGAYSIRAVAAGRSSDLQEMSVQAGDMRELVLTVPPAPPPPTTPSIPIPASQAMPLPLQVAPAAGGSNGVRTIVLVGESLLTIAAAAIGTGYLIRNKLAYSDAKSARESATRELPDGVPENEACWGTKPPKACSVLEARTSEMNRASEISTYAFVSAGVLGVATIATYLIWPTSKRTRSAGNGPSLVPWPTPDGNGVVLRVGF